VEQCLFSEEKVGLGEWEEGFLSAASAYGEGIMGLVSEACKSSFTVMNRECSSGILFKTSTASENTKAVGKSSGSSMGNLVGRDLQQHQGVASNTVWATRIETGAFFFLMLTRDHCL